MAPGTIISDEVTNDGDLDAAARLTRLLAFALVDQLLFPEPDHNAVYQARSGLIGAAWAN